MNHDLISRLASCYFEDLIYLSAGPILLATNPLYDIPGLYGEHAISTYSRVEESTQMNQLPAHVFMVARLAYLGIREYLKAVSAMPFSRLRSVALNALGRNQSILISGESGAGKTETTKLVLRFLSSSVGAHPSVVENRILSSNPILEAFGNAKTLANDNSSRFGKYIKLGYVPSATGSGGLQIAGAHVETYLLEKVRVGVQRDGDRNFHIFYYACAAFAAQLSTGGVRSSRSSAHALTWAQLDGFADCSEFEFLCNHTSVHSAKGLDDLIGFERTVDAMLSVGFSRDEINRVLKTVAIVLRLGNIHIHERSQSDDSAVVDRRLGSVSAKAFEMAASMLEISTDALEAILCQKVINVDSRGDRFNSPLSVSKAYEVRDALARHIYQCLFNYCVRRVNGSTGAAQREDSLSFHIGILDIFGFESFQTNSFEQLCINYTNERIQSLFCESILKFEQELYSSEGVPWNRLDYPDNSNIVSEISSSANPYSLFPMIDEECRIVGGNESNLFNRLLRSRQQYIGSQGVVSASRTQVGSFAISHYVGKVSYSLSGFLTKNKDTLSADVKALLGLLPSLRYMLDSSTKRSSVGGPGRVSVSGNERPILAGSDPSSGQSVFGSTVCAEFSDQLSRLVSVMSQDELHFIRCIRPNRQGLVKFFDENCVSDQLIASGVQQALQIAQYGYKHKIPHGKFLSMFRCLLVGNKTGWRVFHGMVGLHRQGSSESISAGHISAPCPDKVSRFMGMVSKGHPTLNLQAPGQFFVGKTMVFLREAIYNDLLSLKSAAESRASTVLGAWSRGCLARKHVRHYKKAISTTQAVARVVLRKVVVARTLVSSFMKTFVCAKVLLVRMDAARAILNFMRVKVLLPYRLKRIANLGKRVGQQRQPLREIASKVNKGSGLSDDLGNRMVRLQKDLDEARALMQRIESPRHNSASRKIGARPTGDRGSRVSYGRSQVKPLMGADGPSFGASRPSSSRPSYAGRPSTATLPRSAPLKRPTPTRSGNGSSARGHVNVFEDESSIYSLAAFRDSGINTPPMPFCLSPKSGGVRPRTKQAGNDLTGRAGISVGGNVSRVGGVGGVGGVMPGAGGGLATHSSFETYSTSVFPPGIEKPPKHYRPAPRLSEEGRLSVDDRENLVDGIENRTIGVRDDIERIRALMERIESYI